MIITDIKKQVKDTERYSIYIDNKFVFGLSGVDVLYYRLKIGNEISQEKYDEILDNVIYEKAKNTAVKFLGYRARSKKELRDKLIKDYDEDITNKVISMLEKYGYVNDEEYARAYVRDCLILSGPAGYGRRLSPGVLPLHLTGDPAGLSHQRPLSAGGQCAAQRHPGLCGRRRNRPAAQ